MKSEFFYLLFILSATFSANSAQDTGDAKEADDVDFIHADDDSKTGTNEQTLLAKIFNNYSNRVRPCGPPVEDAERKDSCGPTNVHIFVFLKEVDEVNDKDMNFNLQLVFRQTWTDPRLNYSKYAEGGEQPQWLTLTAEEQQYKLWIPDTFFVNEKRGYKHTIDKENIMLRIMPDGTVVYSFRVTLTLSCLMDFHDFPKDKHRCVIDISSYAHTKEYINYEWRDHNSILMSRGFKQNVANYELERIRREYCPIVTTTGRYSCVRLGVQFKRQFNYAHFGYLYLPSFVLVCVSWLSFWLGTEAIITRATVSLFCFLTLIIHTAIISDKFPPVSTYRSIDVWLTICMGFLVAGLLQLILIYRMVRSMKHQSDTEAIIAEWNNAVIASEMDQIKRKKSMKPEKFERMMSQNDNFSKTGLLSADRKDSITVRQRLGDTGPNVVVRMWRRCTRAQKLDVICRWLFPFAFFVVNVSYWWSLQVVTSYTPKTY